MLYTVPDPTRCLVCVNIFAGSACLRTAILIINITPLKLFSQKNKEFTSLFQSGDTVSFYTYTSNFLSGSARFDGSIGSLFLVTMFPLRLQPTGLIRSGSQKFAGNLSRIRFSIYLKLRIVSTSGKIDQPSFNKKRV
jgi:hypothetical protein